MRSVTRYQIIAVLIFFKINVIYSGGDIHTIANNKQYYINPDQKYTWFDGLSECLKLNMTLVSIETQEKSDEINKLVKGIFNKNVILWVGGILTHYPDSRNYIWISTGEKFNYTFWKYQNPDFSLNNEYCIQIGSASNMEWNDNVCEVKYGYICEYTNQKQINAIAEMEKTKLEIEKNLQKCQQNLQEHDVLKENLKFLTKELQDLQLELVKLRKELQDSNNENTLKRKELSDEKTNLQDLQKHLQDFLAKKLPELESEAGQVNVDKHQIYRPLSFQFNQNAYFWPNSQRMANNNN